MKTVGAGEAKRHFAQLLDEVERGEEITITRHGRPVAKLVAVAAVEHKRDPVELIAAMERIRELSRGKHTPPEEIREWINEGRRF